MNHLSKCVLCRCNAKALKSGKVLPQMLHVGCLPGGGRCFTLKCSVQSYSLNDWKLHSPGHLYRVENCENQLWIKFLIGLCLVVIVVLLT